MILSETRLDSVVHLAAINPRPEIILRCEIQIILTQIKEKSSRTTSSMGQTMNLSFPVVDGGLELTGQTMNIYTRSVSKLVPLRFR